MQDLNADRIRELVQDFFDGEKALKALKKELKLKSHKDELKKLLVHTVEPNDKGQHVVVVDGLKAQVFMRAGSVTIDKKKAKELLHPNTFNAIKKVGKDSTVLDTIREIEE